MKKKNQVKKTGSDKNPVQAKKPGLRHD